MAEVVRRLSGHSGSEVYIIKENDRVFVKKIGDTSRNLERIESLSKIGLNMPKIYSVYDDTYEMEYINNIDMKTYLLNNGVKELCDYIKDVVHKLSFSHIDKDYTPVYEDKLGKIKFQNYSLNFNMNELMIKLPKILPSTEYHGDFTLDNILFDQKTKSFRLIDPLTTEYDSYVFDLAKLRQDLICGWFIRNDDINLKIKLDGINFRLTNFDFYDNNYLLILMLLRVLPYCKSDKDIKFLVDRMNMLWK